MKEKIKRSAMEKELDKKLEKNESWIGFSIGKQKNGEPTDDEVITIFVKSKISSESEIPAGEKVPSRLKSRRTDVVEFGDVVAHSKLANVFDASLDVRLRPTVPGCSIRNFSGSGKGTLGPLFRDEPFQGVFYGGSNTHVLFEKPTKDISDQASREIVQPGNSAAEGDKIGLLVTGTRININGDLNTRDSALFEYFNACDASPFVPGYGVPEGVKESHVGDGAKIISWKMNGEGKLMYKGVTIKVGGYDGGTGTFVNIDIYERMSSPGTSGTGVVSSEGKYFVGLNFAGSDSITAVVPFAQAFDIYGKVPVLKDWWDEYSGSGGDDPDDPDNPDEPDDTNPPTPPDKWSLRSAAVYLILLGSYLVSKSLESTDMLLIALSLLGIGLIALFLSLKYGIQKTE